MTTDDPRAVLATLPDAWMREIVEALLEQEPVDPALIGIIQAMGIRKRLEGQPLPASLSVGARVRTVANKTFDGHVGIVVSHPKTEYGVRFPAHLWQEKRPDAVWFFRAEELEVVG